MTTQPKHADPAAIAAIDARMDKLRSTLVLLRDQLSDRAAETGSQSKNFEMGHSVDAAPSDVQGNPNRPKSLDEMVGQEDLVMQLRTVIAGAQVRGEPLSHCLLVGPAGFGKTSLSEIIASEIGAQLVATTGMLLKKPTDLIGLLMKTEGLTVLFIDEIHAMHKTASEVLYGVMEDKSVNLLAGTGADTEATTKPLPNVIIVGATTRPGLLATPFRDRFGFIGTLAPYTSTQLATIVGRFWERRGMRYSKNEPMQLAQRCKATPRRALQLGERVLDYVAVRGMPTIANGTVASALSVFGINAHGFDDLDQRVLSALTREFAGRAIGLDALAQFLNVDPLTLSDQSEPYLSQQGLLIRTGRGRLASAKAYDLMRAS